MSELPHQKTIRKAVEHVSNGGTIRVLDERERRLQDMAELKRRRKAHIDKVISDIYRELGKEEPQKESWLVNDV